MKLIWKSFYALQALFFCLAIVTSPVSLAAEPTVQPETAQLQIDINSADATTLAEVMDGVGMVKAQEIIAYRQQIGKFQSLDQLLEVSGIGTATLEKNRHRLRVLLD